MIATTVKQRNDQVVLAHELVVHGLYSAALHETPSALINEFATLALANVADAIHAEGTPGDSLDTAVRTIVWAIRNLPTVTTTAIEVLDGVIDDMASPRTVAEQEVSRATIAIVEAFKAFSQEVSKVISAKLHSLPALA